VPVCVRSKALENTPCADVTISHIENRNSLQTLTTVRQYIFRYCLPSQVSLNLLLYLMHHCSFFTCARHSTITRKLDNQVRFSIPDCMCHESSQDETRCLKHANLSKLNALHQLCHRKLSETSDFLVATKTIKKSSHCKGLCKKPEVVPPLRRRNSQQTASSGGQRDVFPSHPYFNKQLQRLF